MSEPPAKRRTDDEIRAALRERFTGNPAKDLIGFRLDELEAARAAWALECVRQACAKYPR